MKILIVGASGAISGQLVPQLVASGHEVVGTTRSAAKTGALRAGGAEPVIVDAIDPDSMADVVATAAPEIIVHQATALNGPINMRKRHRRPVSERGGRGAQHALQLCTGRPSGCAQPGAAARHADIGDLDDRWGSGESMSVHLCWPSTVLPALPGSGHLR
jgi:uncharacterized protein YbjT (DUF2867 family)